MSSPRADGNSIGFVRALLAGLVVYSHAYYLGDFGAEPLLGLTGGTLVAGTLAVQAFFVLSGRLIAESWLRRPRLGVFLAHRALRLLPALWVCLAIVAFGFTPLLHLARPAEGASWPALLPEAFSYVVDNLFLPRSQVAVGPYPGDDWNGSLWTLFYEGAAYLMVAALGLLSLLDKRRAAGVALLLALLGLNLVWHLVPGLLPAPLPRLFDTPGKQLTLYFFAGMLWALVPALDRFTARRGVGAGALALLVVAMLLGWHEVAGFPLLPPALFWLCAALPLRGFEKAVGGDYSYGLYLYGYPVHQALAWFGAPAWGFWPWFLAGLASAAALAVLSWHLVEKNALALRRHLPRSPATAP